MLPQANLCGAKRRDGGKCQQPAMSNGRCRIHGGATPPMNNSRVKHGLYRRRLQPDEQELFDMLYLDPEFDDLKKEIAMVRLVINRCFIAITEGEESRVPMQVLPNYIEKLIKLIERMRPHTATTELVDELDQDLLMLMNEQKRIAELAEASKQVVEGEEDPSAPTGNLPL